jgi:hydrogenase maturation protein HypF
VTAGSRIEIRGTVQGVGFRPWVARLARRLGVRGRVRNDARGVVIEAFGAEEDLDRFVLQLRKDAPPAARIVSLRTAPLLAEVLDGFAIEISATGGDKALSIPPDLATCAECEAEVFDPHDRRQGYAFTNCTSCGPRFTISTGIPYDRAQTTMASFDMCDACKSEYEDVDDRRFHAQPNACAACGPSLRYVALGDAVAVTTKPLVAAADLLQAGGIVGVKGLGGFHLACDATNPATVRLLRERKRRDEKPFAVMVRRVSDARKLASLSAEEEALLESAERPIVLLERAEGSSVVPDVSPDTPLLGLFLPYTPLHHLLLDAVGRPLVMTSANVSDEPICKGNEEARRRLDGIADALLLHDREIAMRCDDSVVRVIAGAPTVMRRSRGFVPRPFMLKSPVTRPVLACGAHLKNTFCIATQDTAYFGPHIGDLETVAALEFFEEAIDHMETILSIRPEVIAHDLHPGYLSTRYALARRDAELVGVQHHHAHVVSLMAEHGTEGPVLGLAFDGTGAGSDGASWGGEFLLCFPGRFERLATFRPIRLPGGNLAMREVWRIAQALLHDAFDGAPPIDELGLFQRVPSEARRLVAQMLERDLNAPPAHGVGRYFDAFGALGLGRAVSTYEGQVAVAWDFAVDPSVRDAYPFEIDRGPSPIEIDLRPAVRAMVDDLRGGVAPGAMSARFHRTLVDASAALADELLRELGPLPVGLTGGVFQNQRLCAGMEAKLHNKYEVLRHREVPPGDGGIAVGQALIAAAFLGDKG